MNKRATRRNGVGTPVTVDRAATSAILAAKDWAKMEKTTSQNGSNESLYLYDLKNVVMGNSSVTHVTFFQLF